MKFTVTQEDIDKGVAGDGESCPIALAACKVLPSFRCEASEDSLWIFGSPKGTRRFDLPVEACNFVVCFDAGDKMQPFSFEIPELNP